MKKEEHKKETKKKEEPKKEVKKQSKSAGLPVGVKIISFFYFASALMLILISVFFIVSTSLVSALISFIPLWTFIISLAEASRTMLFMFAALFFIASIFPFLIGWLLWNDKKWMRTVVIVVSVLAIISAVGGIINGYYVANTISLLLNGAAGGYLIWLDFIPKKKKKEQETKEEGLRKKKERSFEKDLKKFAPFVFVFFLIIGLATYFLTKNIANAILVFAGPSIILGVYLILRDRLLRYQEVKKMEEVFPDFISLMASNLRAGMTVDRALLLSSRKEFAPLDKEIVRVGKDILTAREITRALEDMAKRIGSEEIKKTVQIIVSGLRSGGNLSIILEETASNMRERMFVQKRAASNVLMYVIFIFFAVSMGAPLLFGLSSVLVEVMTNIFADIGTTDTSSTGLPFSFSEVNVSTTFIFYFSLSFIVAMSLMAALMLGLVSKGKEKEGLKYIIPLIVIGVAVFLISRIFLLRNFAELLG